MEASRRRSKLGGSASAALVGVWEEIRRRGWSDAQFANELGEDSGKIARLLYGDRKPGRQLAAKLFARLGTPLDAWDRPCPVKRRPHDDSGPLPIAEAHAKAG